MSKVKTGIVMLNLGGPANLDEVEPFLLELFADREIIQLPFQHWLGPFIARRRAPKVRGLYDKIGGGSPILRYTRAQGQGMVERLDRLSPDTAPHGFYVAFRYIQPKSEDALRAMAADGVERAVAFTQYPQFSCSTTGSSLNELWRAAERTGLRDAFEWSIIDRWPVHAGFIGAITPQLGTASQVAHNSFISLLVEQGLIGLMLYLLMLVSAFLAVRRLSLLERRFGLVLMATLVVAMLPLTWEHRKPVWFILAALVGLAQAHRAGIAARSIGREPLVVPPAPRRPVGRTAARHADGGA